MKIFLQSKKPNDTTSPNINDKENYANRSYPFIHEHSLNNNSTNKSTDNSKFKDFSPLPANDKSQQPFLSPLNPNERPQTTKSLLVSSARRSIPESTEYSNLTNYDHQVKQEYVEDLISDSDYSFPRQKQQSFPSSSSRFTSPPVLTEKIIDYIEIEDDDIEEVGDSDVLQNTEDEDSTCSDLDGFISLSGDDSECSSDVVILPSTAPQSRTSKTKQKLDDIECEEEFDSNDLEMMNHTFHSHKSSHQQQRQPSPATQYPLSSIHAVLGRKEVVPTFPKVSEHFWSVKHLSKHGGCAINFNDFTLDKGATNPNWLAPSSTRKKADSSLDAQYEVKRKSRSAKQTQKKVQQQQQRQVRKQQRQAKKRTVATDYGYEEEEYGGTVKRSRGGGGGWKASKSSWSKSSSSSYSKSKSSYSGGSSGKQYVKNEK